MLRTRLNSCLALLRRSLQPLYREEEGAHLVLLSLMLTMLLGFAGLAIDGSNLYYQQQRMQIAADAAALGGARQLALNAPAAVVDAEICNLAEANYADPCPQGVERYWIENANRVRVGVHVTASRTFESFFAKLFGYNTFTVKAQSEAQYEPVTAVDGLFPLTLDCDCVDETTNVVPPRDDEQEIPEIPQAEGCGDLHPIALSQQTLAGKAPGAALIDIYNGVQPGNFGWLSWEGTTNTPDLAARLTPQGNSYLYTNPYDSGDHEISIGDWVLGSPGVANADEIRAALDILMTLDITVPVWNNVAGTGSNALYQVVDFADVRITSYTLPNQNRISATFLGYNRECRGVTSNNGLLTIVDDNQSSYEITFKSLVANTWTYQVRKISGADLTNWSLGIDTCSGKVSDGSTAGTWSTTAGVTGLRWDAAGAFDLALYSFTLDGAYPAGSIDAQVTVGAQTGITSIRGPICDGSPMDDVENPPSEGICLPTIDFEVDGAGASLPAGQIVAYEWPRVQVSTGNPTTNPPMIFDSANPTGNDPDLGSPHEDWNGPGRGLGGGMGKPGQNSAPLGKVLIVAETNNPASPDDAAGGGTLQFTFDYPVRIDEVHVLDIEDAGAAGSVHAYDENGQLTASARMLGLGDNSFQVVPVDASNVRYLEISLPKGGSVPAIVSCRSQQGALYRLGSLIWADANNNGIQDNGEAGIPGVELELYAEGETYVIDRATTNVAGEYLFANLPAGNYVVQIAAANFAAGGPLENTLYSPANATSDDLDSDFTAEGGALALLPLNGGDNYTVDGGFGQVVTVEPGPETVVVNLSDNQGSSYEIALAGHDGSAWSYRVTEVSGHNLEQWNLGIANCLDKITSYDPTAGYAAGVDSSTGGFTGIRWGVDNSFSEAIFSFTLDANYPAGSVAALVKSNKVSGQINIIGPDCSQPPVATPDPDPDPDDGGSSGSSGEEAVCSFSWLDWDGGTSSYQELKSDMDNTGRSGVWRVGDVVQPGPPVSASIFTRQGLDARVGKKVKIPLSNYNGSGHAICGFAEVTLVDYELQDGNRWLGIDWLVSLIRSVESDPEAVDYKARDVRVLR